MPTFVYTEYKSKAKYGENIDVVVWQLKQNVPIFVGKWSGNTGSYKGECGQACEVIEKVMKYKVKPKTALYSPSDFVRKDINLFKLDGYYNSVRKER